MGMTVTAYNKNSSYDSLCTSGEIIKAIETLAGDDIRDETSAAYKMWSAPTVEQDAEIADLAWSYASEETEQLYWGGNVAYKRTV
jgi:hypothetical protein